MIQSLAGPMDCVYAADQELRWAWLHTDHATRSVYLRALAAIERQRQVLKDSLPLHRQASRILASQVSSLPEQDFPGPPRAERWIRFARDWERLDILNLAARCQLRRVIQLSAVGSVIRYYGGLKPHASVEQKIYEYWRGRAELDLWDLVRFRIVAVNIQDVCRLGVAMRELFRERVVRSRNYYTNPKGPDDAYRAVHFEIDLGEEEEPAFVEVQILTLRRDAVGLIDHGVIYKHAVASHETLDEEWLRSLSYAANIVDARVN